MKKISGKIFRVAHCQSQEKVKTVGHFGTSDFELSIKDLNDFEETKILEDKPIMEFSSKEISIIEVDFGCQIHFTENAEGGSESD